MMSTESQYRTDIRQLFNAVKDKGTDLLRESLFHILKDDKIKEFSKSQVTDDLPKTYNFYLVSQCLHNNTNLSCLIKFLETRQEISDFHIIHLKLYTYFQVIETRYIYKVIGNCLRALLNKAYDGALFDTEFSGCNCFEKVIELYGRVKNDGSSFSLFEKWDSFIDRALRNAIAHNDFFIKKDAILIPYYLIRGVLNPSGNQLKGSYTFEEIDNKYQDAVEFSKAFKAEVEQYINLGPRY